MKSIKHMETTQKLAALVPKVHDPNKVGLDPYYTWIKCTKASSWCSKGSLIYALVETYKTSPFNAYFNASVLHLIISPFGTLMDPC